MQSFSLPPAHLSSSHHTQHDDEKERNFRKICKISWIFYTSSSPSTSYMCSQFSQAVAAAAAVLPMSIHREEIFMPLPFPLLHDVVAPAIVFAPPMLRMCRRIHVSTWTNKFLPPYSSLYSEKPLLSSSPSLTHSNWWQCLFSLRHPRNFHRFFLHFL